MVKYNCYSKYYNKNLDSQSRFMSVSRKCRKKWLIVILPNDLHEIFSSKSSFVRMTQTNVFFDTRLSNKKRSIIFVNITISSSFYLSHLFHHFPTHHHHASLCFCRIFRFTIFRSIWQSRLQISLYIKRMRNPLTMTNPSR